jgi:two-component system chemotaxis response regulator CheB
MHVGDLVVSKEPVIISTILGSCISVCLFERTTTTGGMIHFAYPTSDKAATHDYRYGDVALVALAEKMRKVTGKPNSSMVAKIVGGAEAVGMENLKIARLFLKEAGIPVVGEDVGGASGRRALFHTATGRLQVADVKSTTVEKKPMRKVLIVDDSKTIRDLLTRILKEDPDLEIIGVAEDVRQAEEIMKKVTPDVITLDIHMPIMSGVDWLETLLPRQPIPVVMISSLQLQDGNEVFRALELGAIDYIQKPSFPELNTVAPVIREKVKEASHAKVCCGRNLTQNRTHTQRPPVPLASGSIDTRKILAIGASTGGTEALKSLLCAMPEVIPPTLIVQHIPPVFSKAFADRLNELCPFEVKEAEDGDILAPSRVLIAPGGRQMKLERTQGGYRVRVNDDPPMSRHKPSVDYLFHSVAKEVGKNVIGVILTGMGADGAKGLLAMKNSGAQTIGQDEESCVVYGMPRVAYEIGAVEKVLPLSRIPNELVTRLSKLKSA